MPNLTDPRIWISAVAMLLLPAVAALAEPIEWPSGAQVAVSLSYDDALESQLDNAVPGLERHGFRASFYVPAAYPGLRARLEDWRALAERGHELGNHTLFHACAGHREWVEPEQDLSRYTLKQIVREVRTANTFLQAIDGRYLRTFTPPCFDLEVAGQSYLPHVADAFIGIKGMDNGLDPASHVLMAPDGASGEELVAFVVENTRPGMLVNILFHGVGGDHLAVSTEAHEFLLNFLAENRETYWVDTYRAIMEHVQSTLD